MKLGFSAWGMPTVPVDAIVRHLAELGFDGVELTVLSHHTTALEKLTAAERKRIPELLRSHSLELPAIAGHVNLMDEDNAGHAANMERLRQTVNLASEWAMDVRPPVVDTTAGGKPEDWEDKQDMLVERLGEAGTYARSQGVTIAIEPHVGSIIDTPQRMVEVISRTGTDGIGVNFDISHFNVMGIGIEESVSALAQYSVHTHVKDERGTVPDFEFLVPGEGEFDYVSYLESMKRHGYTGYITAEISNMVQRRQPYYPLETATQTYETLAAAFVEAGIERV